MQQMDANLLVRSIIQRIAVGPDRGRDISEEESRQVMLQILEGKVDPVQAGVILIALRMKRESIEEFQGLFRALQSELEMIEAPTDELFCLADPFNGYERHLSMTPFLPAVLAANAHNTIMSGVESVGPKFGVTTHQVLKAAGIATDLGSQDAVNCLMANGWAYLDQRGYAPRLYELRDLRDRIVKRSALTTLERLLMPVRARRRTHLILGYVHRAYPEIYGAVAKTAGFSTSLLTKGVEGGLAPATNKPLRQSFTDFKGKGVLSKETSCELPTSILSGTAAAPVLDSNADRVASTLNLGIRVLNGERGVARNSLVLAASQVLFAHSAGFSLGEVVEKVQRSLDNGSALETFNALRPHSSG